MLHHISSQPLKGFEDQSQQIGRVLKALQSAGFSNPIAFGTGLNLYLNDDKDTKTPIKIQCDFPQSLVPGKLSMLFEYTLSSTWNVKSMMVGNIMTALQKTRECPHALSGLTYGQNYSHDNETDTLNLTTRGLNSQKLDITFFREPALRFDMQAILEQQHGTKNKIVMRIDPESDQITTIMHPQWREDSTRKYFRITEDLSISDTHRSLAAYFHERAAGQRVSLHIDDTSLQKDDVNLQTRASYIHDLQRTAMKLRSAKMMDFKPSDYSNDPKSEEQMTYREAAQFIENLFDIY